MRAIPQLAFVCTRTGSPGYQFYRDSLLLLNSTGKGRIEVFTCSPEEFNPEGFDAVMLMGFDPLPPSLRQRANDTVLVVIDPRASQRRDLSGYDLAVHTGLEARDWFAGSTPHDLIYAVYPVCPPRFAATARNEEPEGTLIVGYHGNALHLDAMVPRITDALSQLAQDRPVALWAMYNFNVRGRWEWPLHARPPFAVRHIPYCRENYARYMAHVDIGLVPQFVPVRNVGILRYLIGSLDRRYHEKRQDFFLRFKETTNIGRALVFAQYGVPVISDMTPSAVAFLEEEVTGFTAFHTAAWLRALRRLANSQQLRQQIGTNLREKWENFYAHELQNQRLLDRIIAIRREKAKASQALTT